MAKPPGNGDRRLRDVIKSISRRDLRQAAEDIVGPQEQPQQMQQSARKRKKPKKADKPTGK
jgi:hypothetical protein